MIRFTVDPASPIPIYQQVKQTILIEILSGRLQEGDRLPPIRVLAKILKINPNTVAKVYYNLDDEGYIKGKVGSGYTVRPHKSKLDNLKASIIEEEFKRFLETALSFGYAKEDIESLMRRYLINE